MARLVENEQGRGGLWQLAANLTDQFEKLNEGRAWEDSFYDELEDFLREKDAQYVKERS